MDQLSGERGLWAAVVLRARDDILGAVVFGSAPYGAAEAFFTAPGDWSTSRQHIADCLGVHVDDITRMGRAAINARRAEHGLAPLPVEPPKPKPKPPVKRMKPPVPVRRPLPLLVAVPAPAAPMPPPKPVRGPPPTIEQLRERGYARFSARWGTNPFNPFRRQG